MGIGFDPNRYPPIILVSMNVNIQTVEEICVCCDVLCFPDDQDGQDLVITTMITVHPAIAAVVEVWNGRSGGAT